MAGCALHACSPYCVPFHRSSPACPVFQLCCSLLCLCLWIVEQFQLPAVPPALCARPPCSSCKTWHELHFRDTVPQTAALDRLSSVLSSCSQITHLRICPIASPLALQYNHEVLENFNSSAPQNSLTLCLAHKRLLVRIFQMQWESKGVARKRWKESLAQ